MKRLLSGITPSGDGSLHIGNYLGAVKQFIELSKTNETYLMVADLHALTTVQDKDKLSHNIDTLVLNELALLRGFMTEAEFNKIVFFRQSDVPMHTELQSILNNVTPLGLLKRAHAYKDKLQKDVMEDDINVGLFSYPMLMAADILLYQPDLVPVGKDQKQHVEITRDIAERFNKTYGGVKREASSERGVFKLPEPFIPEEVAVVMGTDGKRKMSKSLGNIISIFESEEVIKKQIRSTYTDPTRAHSTDPGHTEGNMVFAYLDFLGDTNEVRDLKERYKIGKVSDVEVKEYLFKTVVSFFAPARRAFEELKANPTLVKEILKRGQEQAQTVAGETMKIVKNAIGIITQYSISNGLADGARKFQSLALKSEISIEEFAKAEMRVGKVIDATNKEGSEKLIRLVVDFGPTFVPTTSGTTAGKARLRIIFTGVRGFGYTPDDFLNKQFFFITNLTPRKMMDEESQGMILAVDSTDKSKPLFISAEGLPLGAKIR